jgi:hypothetical protein
MDIKEQFHIYTPRKLEEISKFKRQIKVNEPDTKQIV